MIFTEIVKKENTITIDGYSKAKTVKGAIKDLSKEVAKYSSNEATKYKESEMEYKEANYYIAICFVK